MKEHMAEEPEVWSEWVHECRLSLMRAELDWGIHMGHEGKEKPDLFKHSTSAFQYGLMD